MEKQYYYILSEKKEGPSFGSLFTYWWKEFPKQKVMVGDSTIVCVKLPCYEMFSQGQKQKKQIKRFLYEKMIEKRIGNLKKDRGEVFYVRELDTFFKHRKKLYDKMDINTSLPEVLVKSSLSLFLKKECFFRKSTKVFVVDNSRIDVGEILFPYCHQINYLQFLISPSRAELENDYERLADEIFEESGLAISITRQKENIREGNIVIDLREEFKVPLSFLPKDCIYFDGFGSGKKERLLRGRREDIFYFSARKYLEKQIDATKWDMDHGEK